MAHRDDADAFASERADAEAYEAFRAGDPDPLPWPPAEPADYRYDADGEPFF